ncbi:uncharacterized protein LOC121409054 [Lytechinus variegatus]|uniref:uncharacterized protein LOC121409054 n=1 Tax=Lytechinus variegatus TaxID=7654 RepID=UPI001BB10863|nr:uncharacterized protein LOC121409054 [Lytechinus variegatus]XP_054768334.1 uncharacterized protein LOC129275887 [Lytechinus pictus]
MNNFVFVALLAIFVYIMLTKSSFEIESGIFIYQKPSTVYKAISSMDIIERFQPYVVSTKKIGSEKSADGIITEFHTIEEHVPTVFNFTLPVIFDTKMEFTKPDSILNFHYSVWYGTVVGHVTWGVEPRSGHRGPGAYLSYHARISSPWVTKSFTEASAKEAQNTILTRMRIAMEKL